SDHVLKNIILKFFIKNKNVNDSEFLFRQLKLSESDELFKDIAEALAVCGNYEALMKLENIVKLKTDLTSMQRADAVKCAAFIRARLKTDMSGFLSGADAGSQAGSLSMKDDEETGALSLKPDDEKTN
ncbi:MAG: hypothetical protein JW982_07575, partial [Spirochaetes bacterium]|nr:hypothetical protein [Spirochaetota bacterium]